MSKGEAKARGMGPVLFTVLLDLLGFGLVIPLLSFYAQDYHASPLQVTLLMASYSLAQFVFAPVWGAISDRVGRRPVMLVSIAGTSLALAGFAASQSLALLFLFRILNGAFAANISTAQAYVADVTTPENRAKGMGLIGAAFGVGFTLGPWVGGELARFGYAAPIWVASALSAINFVWAYFGLPESRPVGERARTTRGIHPRLLWQGLAHPVVGLAVGLFFIVTFAFSMMESTFALVAEHAWGMGPIEVGRLFLLIGAVGIVVQGGLVGRLAKRFGEARLVGVGYLLNAAGLAILASLALGPVEPAPWLPIGVGCLLLALGISLANPSLNSLISRGVGPDDQGAVLGANQSLAALARATAPAVGGVLYTGWFMGGAMAAGAVMMALALLLAVPAARRATAGRLLSAPPAPRSAASSRE